MLVKSNNIGAKLFAYIKLNNFYVGIENINKLIYYKVNTNYHKWVYLIKYFSKVIIFNYRINDQL